MIFDSLSIVGVWAVRMLNSRTSSVFSVSAKLFHASVREPPKSPRGGLGTSTKLAGSGCIVGDFGSGCPAIASLMEMDGITGRGAVFGAIVDVTGCGFPVMAETKWSDFFFDSDV